MLSWLSLPSFTTVPSLSRGIQQRLVSFVLKRFLGRFVQSNSFDEGQIDSQIGNGVVQVHGLVLDNEASVQSKSSSLSRLIHLIGHVTATLPWPNIFTAPIALTVSDLHLSFEVIHLVEGRKAHTDVDLSESVASVAETFVHDELTANEERNLEESLLPPGAFHSSCHMSPSPSEGDEGDDASEKGVSTISALIENIISRFTFNLSSATLSLVLPDGSGFEIRVEKLTCLTEGGENHVFRVAEISGLQVRHMELRAVSSSSSSSSSMDDDVTMMMSQSMYGLPQAPSMNTGHQSVPKSQADRNLSHDMKVIASLDSRPVVLKMKAVSNVLSQEPQGLQLTLEAGNIAFAMNPRHLCGAAMLSQLLSAQLQPSPPTTSNNQPRVNVTVTLHGIDGLLVPISLSSEEWSTRLAPFLSQPASASPQIQHLHLHLRDLYIQLNALPVNSSAIQGESRRFDPYLQTRVGEILLMSGGFAILSEVDRPTWISTPVVVSDNNLNLDSDLESIIENVDWRGGTKQFKPSHWRQRDSRAKIIEDDIPLPIFALDASKSSLDSALQVRVSPLHIFIDLSNLKPFTEFLLCFQQEKASFSQTMLESTEGLEESPPSTPRARNIEIVPVGRSAISKEQKYKPTPIQTSLTLSCPGVRIRLKCPVPRNYVDLADAVPRSGFLIVDVMKVSMGWRVPAQGIAHESDKPTVDMGCERLVCFVSRAKEVVSRGFLSISLDGSGSLVEGQPRRLALQVSLRLQPPSLVNVDVGTLLISLTKSSIDALQYLADDTTKCMGNSSPLSSPSSNRSSAQSSRVLGSRYFVNSRQPSLWEDNADIDSPAMNLMASIATFKVKLTSFTPHAKEARRRPLCIHLSARSTQILLRSKPDSHTTASVKFADLRGQYADKERGETDTFLLTIPLDSMEVPNDRSLEVAFTSYNLPTTTAKESNVEVAAHRLTVTLRYGMEMVETWSNFFKPPPQTFESVPPSEKTNLSLRLTQCTAQLVHEKASVASVYLGKGDIKVQLVGNPSEISVQASISNCTALFLAAGEEAQREMTAVASDPMEMMKGLGHVPIAEIERLDLKASQTTRPGNLKTEVAVSRMSLILHACADTISPITEFFAMNSTAKPVDVKPSQSKIAQVTSSDPKHVLHSMDDNTFRRPPVLGSDPDLIGDDLPTNLDYLDMSFGTAAGLQELADDDFEDFDDFRGGIETFKLLDPDGIQVIEDYFENLPPEETSSMPYGETLLSIRATNCDICVNLHSGYDWRRTQKLVEEHRKRVRRRLAKIRQVLASGQAPEAIDLEETRELVFNSIYVGLADNVDNLDTTHLIAAIDEELADETSESLDASWETVKQSRHPKKASQVTRPKLSLIRSPTPEIQFLLTNLSADYYKYVPGESLDSRCLMTVRNLEILDNMKSSTWKRFLTAMRTDPGGNVRESGSNMVRVELLTVEPVAGTGHLETRLRAKLLPLRLHVDQDALDFLKQFFAFRHPDTTPVQADPGGSDPFFQHVEVFPVHIKLDYKPKRVDYSALKEGKTIELMNFFHFDGAEMTLRHITLSGIAGWLRLSETLNDLWTPDVKANQLSDIISGVSSIRSMVKVGTGVVDLVLLPIAAYQKDKRVVQEAQKGAKSFLKSTALETITLGARLATGTQIVLEQAETVLGGYFRDAITTETLSTSPSGSHFVDGDGLSRYANQPENVKDGLQTAYRSMSKNLSLAGQTILALPMEVHERSGTEGAVRTVIRAVPIAMLKPMIGASEAVGKTLLGLRNSMDPDRLEDDDNKYKH